jgi:hypothetical protein
MMRGPIAIAGIAIACLSACSTSSTADGSGASGGASGGVGGVGGVGVGGGPAALEPSYTAVVLPEYGTSKGLYDHELVQTAGGADAQLALLFVKPTTQWSLVHVRYVTATGDSFTSDAFELRNSVNGSYGTSFALHPSGDATVCLYGREQKAETTPQDLAVLRLVRLDASGAVSRDLALVTTPQAGPCSVVAIGEDALVFSREGSLDSSRVDRVAPAGTAQLLSSNFPYRCTPDGHLNRHQWTLDGNGRLWTFNADAICEVDPTTANVVAELALPVDNPYLSLPALDTSSSGRAHAVLASNAGDPKGAGTFVRALPPEQDWDLLVAGPTPFLGPHTPELQMKTRLLVTDRGWTMPSSSDWTWTLELWHAAIFGAEPEKVAFEGIYGRAAALAGDRELWTVGWLPPEGAKVGTYDLAHPGAGNAHHFVAARFRDWESILLAASESSAP